MDRPSRPVVLRHTESERNVAKRKGSAFLAGDAPRRSSLRALGVSAWVLALLAAAWSCGSPNKGTGGASPTTSGSTGGTGGTSSSSTTTSGSTGGTGGMTSSSTTTTGSTGGTGGTSSSSTTSSSSGATCVTTCSQPNDCATPPTLCRSQTCTAGCCGISDASEGTPCTDKGGTVCNGTGSCVKCNTTADCASGICCNNVCTTSDAANCGACGRSCQGQTCSANLCKTVTLAANLQSPLGIAVDSKYVSWGDGTGVKQVPIGGGATILLYTGSSAYLAASGGAIFWTNGHGDQVLACPGGSCNGASLVAGSQNNTYGIAPGLSNIYWVNDANPGSLMSCFLGGCVQDPLTVATGLNGPLFLTVDAVNAYWTEQGSLTVKMVPLAGGTPQTLASGLVGPQGIATDGASVYVADYAGNAVIQVPVAGGASTTVASGFNGPQGIAVDSNAIYWTNYLDGTVMSCPLGGCPTGPLTLATGQQNPSQIAVDATSVYWTNNVSTGGAVVKVAK